MEDDTVAAGNVVVEAKKAFQSIKSMLRAGGGTDIRICDDIDELYIEARHFGDWEGGECEEDPDCQEPTEETHDKLEAIYQKHLANNPVFKESYWNSSEKNWVIFGVVG